jgi:hypothetical protein
MRVYYLDSATGRKRYPVKDGVFYKLGDRRKYGDQCHLNINAISVSSEDDLIDLVMRGFSVRVESRGGGRPSLVRRHLHVDGRKVS